MKLTTLVLAGAAIGLAAAAQAQRIEISSESLGTVIVTPPPIPNARPGTRTARGQNGIDFGLRRRADGSLYDPLDPRQNSTGTSAVGGRSGAVAGGATAGAQDMADNDIAGTGLSGGLPPGGRYGNAPATDVDIVSVPDASSRSGAGTLPDRAATGVAGPARAGALGARRRAP